MRRSVRRALYPNVEHTMLVTLAGHKIFMRRSTLGDYAYFIVACLTNDNEYVKGDDNEGYVIEGSGRKVTLPLARPMPLSPHVTLSVPTDRQTPGKRPAKIGSGPTRNCLWPDALIAQS